MKKQIITQILKFLLIVAIALSTFFIGLYLPSPNSSKNSLTSAEIISLIENVGYVYDPVTGEMVELDQEKVGDILVKSILDKYAKYYPPEEVNGLIAERKGNARNLGIYFYDKDNVIDGVYYDSPADKQGMLDGDRIISIKFGENIVAISEYEDIKQAFSSHTEQAVTFTVLRGQEEKEFVVNQESYKKVFVRYFDSQSRVDVTYKNGKCVAEQSGEGMSELASDTAYIKFIEFGGGAGEQMLQALSVAKQRGKTKLILDVRNNGGGYMEQLNIVASALVYNQGASKTLVAYAKGKQEEYFYTTGNNFNTQIQKIAVIANENSASATECLIGAMLYYKDAFSIDNLIIEKNSTGVAKTHGKGIMQTTYMLTTGGALKLTTALVYQPDKVTNIHNKGIYTTNENSVESVNALSRAIQVVA